MNSAEDYQAARAQLLRVVAQGVRRISLVEFSTLPQLQEILAELRGAHPDRPFIEVPYDVLQDTAPHLVSTIREKLSGLPAQPLPLVVLHPVELRATPQDEEAAYGFWQAMNFRRELFGEFLAQILLCVDPWHLKWLVDRAPDLWSWLMPKIHLTEPPNLAPARTESLPALSAFFEYQISPEAAAKQWDTLWPELEKKSREQRLEPGDLRRYVFPLLESALATGHLVRARQVRDLALGVPMAEQDKIEWHKLNALLACGAGNFGEAEEHARKLLEIARHCNEPTIRRPAHTALINVTNILSAFGHAEACESLSRESLAVAQERYGPEHPDTLIIRNNLAIALSAQGKHAEGEVEHQAVLQTRERVLGPEHVDTLASRNNLANAQYYQGKFAEAEVGYRAALNLLGRVLGPEQQHTLASRNNLANTLAEQGKHAEAEAEHREVLKITERVLGPEHPSALRTCYNLAIRLHEQGKLNEAWEFAQRAAEGARKVLGEAHPDAKDYEKFYQNLAAKEEHGR